MPLHSILLCIPLLLPLPMSRTGINLVWVLSIIQISLLAVVTRCLCPNQGLSPTSTPFSLVLFCSSVFMFYSFLQLFSCVVRLSRQAGKSSRLSVLVAAVRKVPIIWQTGVFSFQNTLSKFLCPFWVVVFFRCPHVIRSAQGCDNYCIKFDCSFPPPPSPQFFFSLQLLFVSLSLVLQWEKRLLETFPPEAQGVSVLERAH